MPGGECLPVIGDGQRQEVKLDVGINDARPAANMTAALEVVGRTRPAPGSEPLDTDLGLAQKALGGKQANRLGALHLEVELHMIHQVFAHFG
ncbi:hypothetical protein D3C81_1956590 [compost metagenome]